ncbi:response regulator [Deinococcus sp. KSM4-11]|uniref:response regulator n=1 Tax=Deinococcus sp. KSM4-11 TaxID=2568654 RepID=UPI0010A5352A|nr:response regulator [Deinococcus sp. KSM4-11]THF88010.1 response regulator [Deinococcus sp. KSM4-11]
MSTILIVEDEPRLADILEVYLRREGFHTERAGDGRRALELWRAARPALILLDLMLPGVDGLEVARRVRAESGVPIIMLTARDEEVDRLLGLGIGADDYVVKPYSPREVVARVKAVLRRAGGVTEVTGALHAGPLMVDTAAFDVTLRGQALDVTVAEVRVLALLAREPGVVRTRAELLAALGGLERGTDERTVDAHLKNLRRKFGDDAALLDTVRGVGYRLRVG